MRFKLLSYLLLLPLAVLLFQPDAHAQRKKKKKKSAAISKYDIDTLKQPIPLNRAGFHTYVDREQTAADYYDGVKDGQIHYGEDSTYSRMLTNALLRDVDQIQVMIENLRIDSNAKVDNNAKIRYIKALENLVRRFNKNMMADPPTVRRQVTNFKNLIIAREEKTTMDFVKENITAATLANVELLQDYPQERQVLYAALGEKEPAMMIRKLGDFADQPYACNVLAEAAKTLPSEVRNYATSTNSKYLNAVRNCKDPLVKTIVRIANESKRSDRALQFLSQVHSGKRTIAEVDKITSDPDLYYKALTELKRSGEIPGGGTFDDELAYRGRKYIREMNDLHEESDAVRFRCINDFTPEEMYTLIVYDEGNELYTSSFLGTFKRIMERLGTRPGDSLLEAVRYDRFRTFIRKCANYNTLTPFLASVNESKRNDLMRDFIANLERGREDDLTDAVDVADAYGSIDDESLTKFLNKEVLSNYERVKAMDSKKGIIVYGLLATLFRGFAEGNVDGDKVGLPPINLVPYRNLVDSSGTVYEQVFFYGDEDGKMSYNSFTGAMAKEGGWKTESNGQWAKFTSTAAGGKPLVVFANLPLMDKEGADEEAQNALAVYLEKEGIKPTVVIHRGHSYHLPETLERLQKQTRVVMLGSCGGYHNLGTVLDKSPDAQIISTKQTGTAFVNEEIIRAINKRLRAGEDIEWIGCWKELGGFFAGKGEPGAKFKDYVPPHRNLGAIFIKAYRRMAADEEDV